MTEQEIRDDEALRVVAYLQGVAHRQRVQRGDALPVERIKTEAYRMGIVFCLSAIRHNEHRKAGQC